METGSVGLVPRPRVAHTRRPTGHPLARARESCEPGHVGARNDIRQVRFNTEQADEVFEERLRSLGLDADHIAGQSLVELEDSLEQIDAAIAHPEAFGILNLKVTAGTGVLLAAATESHVSYGILPLLLARRRLIVTRIRELKAVATEHDAPRDGNGHVTGTRPMSRTVFVVHGRDQGVVNQVARFLVVLC
jgi:hypothetical protein